MCRHEGSGCIVAEWDTDPGIALALTEGQMNRPPTFLVVVWVGWPVNVGLFFKPHSTSVEDCFRTIPHDGKNGFMETHDFVE